MQSTCSATCRLAKQRAVIWSPTNSFGVLLPLHTTNSDGHTMSCLRERPCRMNGLEASAPTFLSATQTAIWKMLGLLNYCLRLTKVLQA
eukprot:1532657-Rhodomonas_salina.1